MEGAGSSTEPIQLPTPVRSSRPLHEILPIEDLPLPEESILNSLHCTNMSIRLRSTLYDLDRLTQALSYTNSHPEMVIDAFRFEEDLIQIQYDLLGELNQFHSNPITGKQSAAIPTSMLLDEPVNLAALLYMRSFIWALRPPMRNRPIFPRLASALSRITKELTREVQDQAHVQPFFFCLSPLLTYMLPLLLWMHFLGGMCSFGDDANLFADGLLDLLAITPKKTLIENGCESWKEVKKMLSRVLWFPSIHDEVGQEFWGMVIDRAMATHDTIYGKEIGLANSND